MENLSLSLSNNFLILKKKILPMTCSTCLHRHEILLLLASPLGTGSAPNIPLCLVMLSCFSPVPVPGACLATWNNIHLACSLFFCVSGVLVKCIHHRPCTCPGTTSSQLLFCWLPFFSSWLACYFNCSLPMSSRHHAGKELSLRIPGCCGRGSLSIELVS